MNKSTKTKKALRGSLFALFLCIVLLIGTTFAWFTDSVTSGMNQIKSGNLDVDLQYSTDMNTWTSVDSSTKLLDDNALWEPGVTKVLYLRVINNGSLALKYKMGMRDDVGFSNGVNVAGETYNVGDYLKIGTVAASKAFANREEAQAAVASNVNTMSDLKPFTADMKVLNAGESDTMALVIYMPTSVGNEANPGTKASRVYRFGVEVNATQAPVESDSFDNTYDNNASTVFHAESASSGTHEITQNIQANGRFGAVQATKTAQYTINADVYAVYTKGGGLGAAMAVSADGTSKVTINGGNFRQVGVPADDECDLIYADGSAQIEIYGGTFKAKHPERTLNCKDDSKAQITVKGGSFYKYDPSHHKLGKNEVVVAEGYHVEQNGDWYKVVAD